MKITNPGKDKWFKGTDRLFKVVRLSMQFCGQILKDSFETLTLFKVDVPNNKFGWYVFKIVF